MYKSHRVSLAIPAYNEKDAVQQVIKGYQSLGLFDEIIVVDNNSNDGTGKLAEECGARVVKESRQGYGYACIRGLKEAKESLIVLTECDGTFRPEDVNKLLEFIDDYDMVIGSRVNKKLNHPDANMNWIIRWGNFVFGKLIEILYPGKFKLDDTGCTFRIIKKSCLDKFVEKLRIGGEDFTPELTFEALKADAKIFQVPISYQYRLGNSKLSPDMLHSFRIGFKHIFHIVTRRFIS